MTVFCAISFVIWSTRRCRDPSVPIRRDSRKGLMLNKRPRGIQEYRRNALHNIFLDCQSIWRHPLEGRLVVYRGRLHHLGMAEHNLTMVASVAPYRPPTLWDMICISNWHLEYVISPVFVTSKSHSSLSRSVHTHKNSASKNSRQ